MVLPQRSLSSDLLPSAISLVAEAFYDNPAYAYICPDLDDRTKRLEWLLGRNLRAQLPGRRSFCLATDAVVDAMGFWTRGNDSEDSGVGVLTLLRVGFLLAPFRLGVGGVRRMALVAGVIDGAAERAACGQPFWYLHNLVIRDELRGQGVGGKLLREELEWIGNRHPGVRILLATQLTENVRFYERLGFSVVAEDSVGTGEQAFKTWTMQAQAQAAEESAR